MKFAIIVPTYQKRSSLRGLLKSLCNQSYSNFKIIIVDNNNDDGSIQFVEDIIKEFSGLNIYHLKARKNLGAGGGRNLGAISEEAKNCDIFAFIDDDCEADCDWLKTSYDFLSTHAEENVIFGTVVSDISPNPPYIHGFDMHGGVFGSGNCAIKREFFFQMGGFDTFLNNWAEDFEIGERCKRLGTEPIYLEKMLVNHPPKLINYSLKSNIVSANFYKKYLYLIKIKKYEYKSHFRRDILKKSLLKSILFLPLLFLGIWKPIFFASPFLINFLIQGKKMPKLFRALNSYRFKNKLKVSSLLSYLFLSWIVDILNGGLLLVYMSPILEKTLLFQIEVELKKSGLTTGGNGSFLTSGN